MTVDWWQKPIWRQTWSVARVGSLLMLVPVAVTVGMQRWQRAEQRRHFPGTGLSNVVFSSKPQTMFAAGFDNRPDHQSNFVAAWDVADGKKRWNLPVARPLSYLAPSPDSRHLLCVTNNADSTSVAIRDTHTGESAESFAIANHPKIVPASIVLRNVVGLEPFAVAWIAGGRAIAVAHEGTLTLYPVLGNSGKIVQVHIPKVEANLRQIENLSFPESFLTTSWQSDLVQVRSTKDGKIQRILEQGQGLSAAVLPDGKRVAVRNLDRGLITLYDAATGAKLSVVKFKPNYASTFQVVDSNSGPGYLEILSQNFPDPFVTTTRLTPRLYRHRWQLKTGIVRPVVALPLDKGQYAFSADGSLLVSLREGNGESHPPLAILHDPQTGAITGRFEGNAGW